MLTAIKNSSGKTICKADSTRKEIEILRKGIKTLISFMPDGSIVTKDISNK